MKYKKYSQLMSWMQVNTYIIVYVKSFCWIMDAAIRGSPDYSNDQLSNYIYVIIGTVKLLHAIVNIVAVFVAIPPTSLCD